MCEDIKKLMVEHVYGASENPAKIKLSKMSKGFQWEISLTGADFTEIIKRIDDANEIMKAKYGGNGSEA